MLIWICTPCFERLEITEEYTIGRIVQNQCPVCLKEADGIHAVSFTAVVEARARELVLEWTDFSEGAKRPTPAPLAVSPPYPELEPHPFENPKRGHPDSCATCGGGPGLSVHRPPPSNPEGTKGLRGGGVSNVDGLIDALSPTKITPEPPPTSGDTPDFSTDSEQKSDPYNSSGQNPTT